MYSKFEELLEKRKVRATDVARATGIHPATFSDWKKGKSKPKLEKLVLIAKYFEVPIEYFIS